MNHSQEQHGIQIGDNIKECHNHGTIKNHKENLSMISDQDIFKNE